MNRITPFLWFNNNVDEALAFYTSIFENSEVIDSTREGEHVPSVKTFRLANQSFLAMNGGPGHPFTWAISLSVDCKDQAEVDNYWSKLLEGGGEEEQCGWLKDRFGMHWQIVPEILPRLMNDPDREKANRVARAMMKMAKLDVAGLQKAYDGN